MKPPCILFLLDWRPLFWSTREEFYLNVSQALHTVGITPILTVSAEVEPRVRQRFEQAGAIVRVVAYNAHYRRYSAYIREIAGRYNILLAHVRFFDYFSLVPWICRWNGVRLIVFTEANSGGIAARAWWKTALVRLRGWFATLPVRRAVGISEFIRRRLVESGIPEKKTCVIANGVDTAAFAPDPGRRSDARRQYGVTDETLVVAWISSLLPWKRPHLVIEVCKRLVDRGMKVQFLAAGKGPLEAGLAAQTRQLGVTKQIHWLGHHPSPQDLLQAADVFLHTSLGEAFGNVLAEAMGCALPVVATSSGAVPEVVAHGVTGLLVDPEAGEAEALAEAFAGLAADPALRRRMGLAARERASQMYSIPIAVAANMALYRKLLGTAAKF